MFGLFARNSETSAGRAWVPGGTRVYAIGDIHGRLDLLTELHRTIQVDAEGSTAERRVVVYIGDYVDRGPDSRGVIDYLIEQPLEGFESVHLLGNHEFFMLDALDDDADSLRTWLMNGGDATLRSYGIDPFDPAVTEGRTRWLQDALREAVSPEQRDFLHGLKWHHVEGDYYFAHAGVRPGIPLEAQSPEDLIWIREPFLMSDSDFGKVVVHGHTPTREPDRKANRIGIDTGAVYGGALTALILEGESQRFIKV